MKLFAPALAALISLIVLAATADVAEDPTASSDYQVLKVMSTPKQLNALGKLGEYSDSHQIGRGSELTKKLQPEDRGEEFTIQWRYSGQTPAAKVTVLLQYYPGRKRELMTHKADYESVEPGTYTLSIANTGESFKENGEIAHWRVSVIEGDETVAEKHSAMWPAFKKLQESAPEEE